MSKSFPFEHPFSLENQRVLLRPLYLKDHTDLLKITKGNPELLQYSPSENHNSVLLTQHMQMLIAGRNDNVTYPFVVYDKQAQVVAGSTSYLNISDKNQRLEIGCTYLDSKFHGTGLNQNMKFLMLQFAFENLEYKRVELKSDAFNLQSRKAMEKIGATYEGSLRSHTLMSDNTRRRDTVYYSILLDEWETAKHIIQAQM